MSQAKRDNNSIPTSLAVDTDGNTEPLRVDPATGRLLIEVAVVSSTDPATPSGKRDNNQIPVSYAITDDASATPTPLIIDNRNGYLFVDLVQE